MDDERPSAKPAGCRAEVDFDPHASQYLEHRHETWQQLRRCPVAYSRAHGGFWVVSGYDEVSQVARDDKTFSSRYPASAAGASQGSVDDIAYVGIAGIPRPRGLPAAGMAEADHALHVALRRLLNSFMLPPAVAALTSFMEAVATWCVDRHIADGHMDLVLDFAGPVPAITTLRILGLPVAHWRRYAEPAPRVRSRRAAVHRPAPRPRAVPGDGARGAGTDP